MSIERARTLVEGVGRLPVMPTQADGLLKIVSDANPETTDVLGVVERDPALTAMVLRLVNSASFGLRTQVSSLRQAVVLLGLSHLRSLALAASMSQLFSSDSGSGDAAWEHAFAVACGARAIALEVAPDQGEAAFAAGMLHDIGALVISSSFASAAMMAEANSAVSGTSRLTAEQEALGCDHGELGGALCERWGLPTTLATSVAIHHRHTEVLGAEHREAARLAGLIATAEALCVAFDLAKGDGDAGLAGAADAAIDPLAALEALGSTRPDAMAMRVRDDIERHVGAGGLIKAKR